MAPPKRVRGQQSKRRNIMSIYPPRSIGPIVGGYRSTPMGMGVSCWSHLMLLAAPRVAEELKPAEWEALYVATRERDFDPQSDHPGQALAEAVRHALRVGQLALPSRAVESLSARLAEMDYVSAWAALTALFYRDYRDRELESPASGDWWTLEYRIRMEAEDEAAREAGEVEGEG